MPKVSMLIPVCQQGNNARETVAQAKLAMGNLDYEIILCDEHSTDGSCHDMPKDVLILRSHFREGCSSARNRLVKAARGEVLIFSDPHCEYPAGCFEALVQQAIDTGGWVQPKSHGADEKWVRYGGELQISKPEDPKGLKVSGKPKPVAKYSALYGTVYVVRKDVYEKMRGWPHLPGIWGCSEQAGTLACYFSKTPITVDTRHTIIHKQLSRTNFFFHVSRNDPASNAWYVHRAFFPRSFDCFWKPILMTHPTWRNYDTYMSHWKTGRFKRFCKNIEAQRYRTEEDFFRDVLGMEPPAGMVQEDKESVYRRRQYRRSSGHDYVGVWPRVERAIRWFLNNSGEHLNGQHILDVGTRDGHALEYYVSQGADKKNVLGVDLSPEAVKHAVSMGRPVSVGDMRNIQFPNRTFDIVSAIHSLEHCPAPMVALNEMCRVLKPEGRLFIAVPEESETKDAAHYVCFANVASLMHDISTIDGMRVIANDVLPLKPRKKEILVVAVKEN